MTNLHIPSVLFTPREANMAAHSIARYVARFNGRFGWLGVEPSWLEQIITDDIHIISSNDRNGYQGLRSLTGLSHNVSLLSV